ncbi:hypothetical protein [Terribacillus aidingensis]|uniref:hypothetical protein n=1 Tax=Terribacillus aidingensis TaxID=586416 RepID=UPI003450F42E
MDDKKDLYELLGDYLSDDAPVEAYIGWSGSTNYGDVGSYVRIDGSRLWLEFASQQGVGYNSGEDADHISILYGVIN